MRSVNLPRTLIRYQTGPMVPSALVRWSQCRRWVGERSSPRAGFTRVTAGPRWRPGRQRPPKTQGVFLMTSPVRRTLAAYLTDHDGQVLGIGAITLGQLPSRFTARLPGQLMAWLRRARGRALPAKLRAQLAFARGERTLMVGRDPDGGHVLVATDRALHHRTGSDGWSRLGWEQISRAPDHLEPRVAGLPVPQADRLAFWGRLASWARYVFWGRRAGLAVPRTKPSRVLTAGRGGRPPPPGGGAGEAREGHLAPGAA